MKTGGRKQVAGGRKQVAGARSHRTFATMAIVFLRPASCRLAPVFGLLLFVSCLLLPASWLLPATHAQVPKGNSPLYSSRPYEARAPSGLPQALKGVGIEQKLNHQLTLDLVFRTKKAKP